MITLYGYLPAWGLPDISPHVSETDCHLRLMEIPFEHRKWPNGDLSTLPKGKLPVIEDAGTMIDESCIILDHLKDKYGDNLDSDLDPEQRAMSVVMTRLFDESYYWYLVQIRYRRDEDFKIYDPLWVKFLESASPEERRQAVDSFREDNLLQAFWWAGMGRNSEAEVEHFARIEIDAIATLLGDKPYFHGDRPTSVDAALYANLSHTIYPPFPSPIVAYARSFPNLIRYCKRIQERYYPDLAPEGPDLDQMLKEAQTQ